MLRPLHLLQYHLTSQALMKGLLPCFSSAPLWRCLQGWRPRIKAVSSCRAMISTSGTEFPSSQQWVTKGQPSLGAREANQYRVSFLLMPPPSPQGTELARKSTWWDSLLPSKIIKSMGKAMPAEDQPDLFVSLSEKYTFLVYISFIMFINAVHSSGEPLGPKAVDK